MITGNNYHRLQFYNDHVYFEFHKSFVFFLFENCSVVSDSL